MSSGDDPQAMEDSKPLRSVKKRRLQRACDLCRRKKVRCDGNQTRNHKCSGCTTLGVECTFIEEPISNAPSNVHVQDLEAKLDRAKTLIHQLCPDNTAYNALLAIVDGTSMTLPEPPHPETPTVNSENTQTLTLIDHIASSIRNGWHSTALDEDVDEDEDEKLAYELSERVNDLHIDHFKNHIGKSSGAILIHRTIEARNGHNMADLKGFDPMFRFKQDVWSLRDWEKIPHISPPTKPFDFPDNDLLQNLVQLYFENINIHLPVLHRPSFTRSCEDGLHLRDNSFAIVLLLVCAVASRYTDDPRTRLTVEDHRSAGWKWFQQAVAVQRTFLSLHNVYDLQFYPIAVQFLLASVMPHACWTLLGIGLRVAQDMGVHRRGLPKPVSFEEELKKRCFWVMLVLDRIHGSHIGRPSTIHDEDIDLELPIECDDECWEHEDPLLRFVQPEGRPSKITAFIWLIKLARLIAVTLRTIYATHRSKALHVGTAIDAVESTVVTELDSSLNKWRQSLPHHLRWDPQPEQEVFLEQTLLLHAYSYYTQIIIHRPYLPTPSRPSRLPFPSLALCTSAARSCSHLLDLAKIETRGKPPPSLIHGPMATAALILLLNVSSHKRSAHSQDMIKRDMDDVQRCIAALRVCQKVCLLSGCIADIIQNLVDSFSQREGASQKRPREPTDVNFSEGPFTSSATNPSSTPSDLAREDQQMQHNEFGASSIRDFTFDSSNLDYSIGPGAPAAFHNSRETRRPLHDPTLEDFSGFFALSESLPGFSMQDLSRAFSTDPSVEPGNTMQYTHPVQHAANTLPLGQESFTAPSAWPIRDSVALPTQDFPANFDLGLESDLMNMNSWSDSPAGILFQGFAPYLANIAQATSQSEE